MDDMLRRFLTKIGITDLAPYEEGSFKALSNDKECNRISGVILFPHYLSYTAYDVFFATVASFITHGGFGITMSFEYTDEDTYFPRLLEEFKEATQATMLDNVQFFEGEKKVLFYYESAEGAMVITEEARKFTDFLDSISSHYKVLTQEKVYQGDDFATRRDDAYQKRTNEAFAQMKEQEKINSSYMPCRLKDIENFRLVTVEGTIFFVEDRKTRKTNALIRKIEYTDGSDSISSSLLEGKRMEKSEITKYHEGVKIRVSGRPEHDRYARDELVIAIDKIEIIPPDPPRTDTYPAKRVELHLHTRMSAFDGVATFEDYAKAAKSYGHTALALTDHGVCQDFPEAQAIGAKLGLKVIYGIEFYMVDDQPKYIYNPSDRILNKETYVVFDLETTGLSARYDHIIEFGAVRMDATGAILDTIDFFINPDMPLSKFSLEISHITQEQVDHGKPIKQALKDILDFFGNHILVGHNVAFDYGFLNEALRNNGMSPISNPVIDTLPISRYLYPEKRVHTEGSLAREMEIEFDEGAAHRANYDAETLGKMFEVMLAKLSVSNPNLRHQDLKDLPVSDAMIKTMHPYHITAYVRNPDGLKDLYRIISESHIRYMSNNSLPLVPKTYLASLRKNLILGSACLNGEVFENAMTKSESVLKETMDFYDFIEVQPPANYIYLIHSGQLHSPDEVLKVLKDLIATATSQGKIVCATSDCHYVNPADKVFRDVLISAKGLKGSRHPLNLAPYDNASPEEKAAWYKNPLPAPDQHFRTTDEMMTEFSFLNDVELEKKIVIENTNKIADLCDPNIKPTKDKLYTPHIANCENMLKDLVFKTAHETYGDPLPPEIQDRLDTELKGIIDNGYSVIYWISSKLVRWSNSQGYMIGSRGSVGSSLVATMSGITEVNPLPPHYRCPHCHYVEWVDPKVYGSGFDLPNKKCPKCGTDLIGDGHNIPFATFLGFHAEKVPDIDLNFPSDFQSTAHQYLKNLLGEKNVFKAGTIQTIQDKNGRGYALGYFESVGKDTSKIRDAELTRLAVGCIGTKRTTGQHPGGVIVIPDDMDVFDFTPVQYPADEVDASWKTTHYDFHAIHDNVLKFDMLGHVDPQAVKMQCDLCGIALEDIREKIPFNDEKAISLFWSADALNLKKNVLAQETGALGLPEFGTEGGRRTLKETKPRSFADLVRISGLSHGTNVFAGNAEDLIVKENHTLRDVIACRDDIMTDLHNLYGIDYSDSFAIMELVRKNKFTLPENAAKHEKYVTLMQQHKVPDYYIRSCNKIEYLFPRGHAVAYVMMAVRCAWFKVYHPLEYYATYFTLRCDAYDIQTMLKGLTPCYNRLQNIKERLANREKMDAKEAALVNTYEQVVEMYDRGYSFENVSITKSQSSRFTVDQETHKIIPSFSCINGVGPSVGDAIVAARTTQPFSSVEDLQNRAHVSDKIVDILRDLDALEDLPDSNQMTLF